MKGHLFNPPAANYQRKHSHLCLQYQNSCIHPLTCTAQSLIQQYRQSPTAEILLMEKKKISHYYITVCHSVGIIVTHTSNNFLDIQQWISKMTILLMLISITAILNIAATTTTKMTTMTITTATIITTTTMTMTITTTTIITTKNDDHDHSHDGDNHNHCNK